MTFYVNVLEIEERAIMAKLVDMEELLGDIGNPNVANYMREAYACYGTGAYRGCIILSYIAVFDDIRHKLKELAKVNKDAKDISKDIEKLAKVQKTFEDGMVNRLEAKDLLTAGARKKLKIIQDIRNSAAHPSGIHATAEDARMVYADVIRSFLSQPLLKTTHAAERILADLGDAYLFPTIMSSDTQDITEELIAPLHPETYSYLVVKLIAEVKGGKTQREENAKRLLFGLSKIDEAQLTETVKKHLIIGCAAKANFASTINLAIASDGTFVKGLTGPQLLRLKKILNSNIENSKTITSSKSGHAVNQFTRLIEDLGTSKTFKLLPKFSSNVLDTFPYSSEILEKAKADSDLAIVLVRIWQKRAQSSDFGTANSLAGAMSTIDKFSDYLLDKKSGLNLLCGCVASAGYGAFDMIALRDNNFSTVPKIRSLALSYIKSSPKKAKAIVEDKAYKSLDEFKQILGSK